MYNWSTDIGVLSKDRDKYEVWKLENGINFGMEGKKISVSKLQKYWTMLSLDPNKKKYLEYLLSK